VAGGGRDLVLAPAGTGGEAGTLSADSIANGGAMNFDNTGELTLAAAISGNGTLTNK